MNRKIVISEKSPKAIGPYSVGVTAGNLVFTAGQLGIDRKTGELVEGGVTEQTRMALTNIGYILEAAGTDLQHVLKTTVYLMDMGEFAKMNEVYASFFKENPPARTTVQVSGLPKAGAVEIEAVAVIP